MTPFKNILVPVDFGRAMEASLEMALSMATAPDAHLTLVNAFDITPFLASSYFVPPFDPTPLLGTLDEEMKKLCKRLEQRGHHVAGVVAQGIPAEVILSEAKNRACDLIVIGTRGRTGLAHLMLGSVAERVVRHSPVPVLTVHPTPPAEAR